MSPARTGGLRIASELIRPKVVSFLDQMLRDTRASLRLEEATVPAGAAAVGKSIGSLGINDVDGALLLAIRDSATGAFTFKPPSETPLRAGASLVVMVDADGRARLEERLKH